MKLAVIFGLALATVIATQTNARADTKLALDLDFATSLDEDGVDAGTGGALRIGQELDLIVVSLTPEVGGSYHSFSGDAELSHYSGFIGGRLAVGKIIEPGIFAHLGIGHISNEFASDTGPALDAGITLDFTLLPILDLGVHAAYDTLWLDNGENFDWVRVGAHASLGF